MQDQDVLLSRLFPVLWTLKVPAMTYFTRLDYQVNVWLSSCVRMTSQQRLSPRVQRLTQF